jgi:hypothetical protein
MEWVPVLSTQRKSMVLDLKGSLSSRSPTLPPGPKASLQPGLVYEHQLIRTKGRYFMHIFVSQIWVALSCDVLYGFLRRLWILRALRILKRAMSIRTLSEEKQLYRYL